MFFDVIDTGRSFALFEKDGVVSCFQGAVHHLDKIEDIHKLARSTRRDIAFVLPYRVIRERGFEAKGAEPLLALEVEVALQIPKEQLIQELTDTIVAFEMEAQPNLSDTEYAELVKTFQQKEIEGGNASQAVLSRIFSGKIKDFDTAKALGIYRKALHQTGQYMTVLFANLDMKDSAKNLYIVGCTPERHLEIRQDETIMIPIAGTLRKEDRDTFELRLEAFLSDPKEVNELFQVTDEEMKMMGIICPEGGEIEGPFLREIGAVVHTEYQLVGRRSADTIAALRRTCHAPTVVGSPMESAARIISKYEPESRRYYAGEIGIYHCPRTEEPNGDLDCAILIRCAEFDGRGAFRVQAGGGLVRDSVPMNEAHETRAKAMGILGILSGAPQVAERYLTDVQLKKFLPLLESRNRTLSPFWIANQHMGTSHSENLQGLKITIINNEDDFAHMIGHMARVMDGNVKVVDTFAYEKDDAEVIVIGPGPGDPSDMTNTRMAKLQAIIQELQIAKTPTLGICLGHQALAVNAGIMVERQQLSTQGMQRDVLVMGEKYRLGFYNSFSPVVPSDGKLPRGLAVDLDENDRIIAMHSDRFIGYQFHPESIMSEDGADLLYRALMTLRISVKHPSVNQERRRRAEILPSP